MFCLIEYTLGTEKTAPMCLHPARFPHSYCPAQSAHNSPPASTLHTPLWQAPFKLLARTTPPSVRQSCAALPGIVGIPCQDLPRATTWSNTDRLGRYKDTPEFPWLMQKVCRQKNRGVLCGASAGETAGGCGAWQGLRLVVYQLVGLDGKSIVGSSPWIPCRGACASSNLPQ